MYNLKLCIMPKKLKSFTMFTLVVKYRNGDDYVIHDRASFVLDRFCLFVSQLVHYHSTVESVSVFDNRNKLYKCYIQKY